MVIFSLEMIANIITIFLYLYLATNNYYIVDGRITSISQDLDDLDLERQLKLINKPPLKTIQADGYIVDCIDINKQPAFDNPLLKNHKIQLKPSFEVTSTKSTRLSSIVFEEDLCPNGTIPIRRTTKDDLIRAKMLSDPNAGILNKDIPGRHYAGLNLNKDGTPYYAISGIIDTYNLPVQNADQITSAYIYLSNQESVRDKNIIMAGWEVHPRVFGDGKTYFFIRWADKTKNKGCTNLICPGFVQVEPRFHLGKPVAQTSIYNGKQFELKVDIFLDSKTNNWWVRLNNISLGYYPGILFSKLAFANLGGWTGMTSTPAAIHSPPMGSGHFPDNNLYRTCYFRQMSFQTSTRTNLGPVKNTYAVASTDSSCYGVEYTGFNDPIQGYAMLFGGPGGNCGQ
ncbi:putative neprosin [Lupinus albus]|uniref:Putative neprosin n=1 Tax=Lupinus albus TaxID=3870 RepID=A0A6A4QTF9_LUPAL|nr:putative neprosin [Lupinus albus]